MTASHTTIGSSPATDSTMFVLLAAFAIPAAALAGAWGIELIGGIAPCPLCLTQRIPYYVGLPIAAIGLLAYAGSRSAQEPRDRLGLTMAAFLLFAAAMAVGTGYGVYHAGVEYGFWQGPTACSGNVATPGTVEEMLSQLGQTRPVNCADVPLRILGLSLAGWNVVVSGGTVILSLIGVWMLQRHRRAA